MFPQRFVAHAGKARLKKAQNVRSIGTFETPILCMNGTSEARRGQRPSKTRSEASFGILCSDLFLSLMATVYEHRMSVCA